MRLAVIEIVAEGKIRERWIAEGMGEYLRRMEKYYKVRYREIKSVEGAEMGEGTFSVALEEKGIEMSSAQFANFLKPKLLEKKMVFVIGGANGLSEEVVRRCSAAISLSKMTYPNQLARVIFAEQLYRAFTILAGEKYHKE